jgi:hypothetical protein
VVYSHPNATRVHFREGKTMSFFVGVLLFAAVVGVLDAKLVRWPKK